MKIIIFKITNLLNNMAYIETKIYKDTKLNIKNYASNNFKQIIKEVGFNNFNIGVLEIYDFESNDINIINDPEVQLKKNNYIKLFKTDINGYNNNNYNKSFKPEKNKINIFYLFKITNILNNMAYIGLTSRKNKIQNNDILALSNEQLKNIIDKEGSDHFKLEVLREYQHKDLIDVNDEELLLKKVKYINKYDTFNNGYNNYIPFKHNFK
jgi:hypothetical protein